MLQTRMILSGSLRLDCFGMELNQDAELTVEVGLPISKMNTLAQCLD